MARTGVCVPLEQHTGFEPAQAAWKAAVLPLHKCCVSPPGSPVSGGPVFADCQDKCHDLCSRWRRMTESNRPPAGGFFRRIDPVAPYCRSVPAVMRSWFPHCHCFTLQMGAVCPCCQALLTSALPLFSPDRGAGLSLQSDKQKEGDSLPGSLVPGGGRHWIRTNCLRLCLPVHIRMCFPPV